MHADIPHSLIPRLYGRRGMGTRPIYIHIKKDYKCWLVAHHLFEKVDWKPSNVVR